MESADTQRLVFLLAQKDILEPDTPHLSLMVFMAKIFGNGTRQLTNGHRIANFTGDARALANGFSIGDKGYIGTGYGVFGDPLQDLWEYDPNLK